MSGKISHDALLPIAYDMFTKCHLWPTVADGETPQHYSERATDAFASFYEQLYGKLKSSHFEATVDRTK